MKSINNKYWRSARKREPSYIAGSNIYRRTLWRFPKIVKIELPYDPAVPPGLVNKKQDPEEKASLKRYIHHNVQSSAIYNSQDMEAL